MQLSVVYICVNVNFHSYNQGIILKWSHFGGILEVRVKITSMCSRVSLELEDDRFKPHTTQQGCFFLYQTFTRQHEMKQKCKLQSTGTLFTCRVAGRFSLMKPIGKRFFKISVIFSVSAFFFIGIPDFVQQVYPFIRRVGTVRDIMLRRFNIINVTKVKALSSQ